jgi:hypothetical protein
MSQRLGYLLITLGQPHGKGKSSPGEKKAALVALRKVRRRDVKKMLAEKAREKGKTENPKKGKGKKKGS